MISEEIYKLLFTSNSGIFIYHTPSNSGLSSLNDLVQFDLRGQKFLTRYTLSKKSTTWSFQVYVIDVLFEEVSIRPIRAITAAVTAAITARTHQLDQLEGCAKIDVRVPRHPRIRGLCGRMVQRHDCHHEIS